MPNSVFALIIAYAQINAHPLVCMSKMVIFWTIFGNFKASYKRPLQKMGKKDPTLCCNDDELVYLSLK